MSEDKVRLIDVTINGTGRSFESGLSITELLSEIGAPKEAIAVALNESIVTRALWPQILLSDGDKVEVVTIYQGG